MPAIGCYRGFCDFCEADGKYTEIKEYKQPPNQETDVIFLCDLCAQLSPNKRKEFPILQYVYHGFNLILQKLKEEK
jgi:hypothetical protein